MFETENLHEQKSRRLKFFISTMFLFPAVFSLPGALQQHVFQGGEDLPESGVSVQTTSDCRLGA